MSLPREGSRVIREGIIVSVPMDWCRSPGCVVPYKIYTHHQVEGANNADSVRQTDAVSHVKESLILKSYGDEPGVGGGCISGTHNAECEPKTWSETVRFEDRNAVRHDDLWWMNHKNCWGRLEYTKDINKYPTPPEARTQYAMLTSPGSDAGGPAKGGTIQLAQATLAPPMAGTGSGLGGLLRTLPPRPDILPPIAPFSPYNPQTLDGQLPEHLRPIPEDPVKPDPDPDPDPDPAPAPKPRPVPIYPDGNRTSRRCYSKEIECFDPKKYDREEYRRQLKLQQDAINAKTPAENLRDINNYHPGLRKDALQAQAIAKQNYIKQHQESFTRKYGSANWSEHIGSLNPIHRLDMVAGGSPTDIAGMGNANINQSIGPSWNQPGGQSRKEQLREYASDMALKKCPMQVILSLCGDMTA